MPTRPPVTDQIWLIRQSSLIWPAYFRADADELDVESLNRHTHRTLGKFFTQAEGIFTKVDWLVEDSNVWPKVDSNAALIILPYNPDEPNLLGFLIWELYMVKYVQS